MGKKLEKKAFIRCQDLIDYAQYHCKSDPLLSKEISTKSCFP